MQHLCKDLLTKLQRKHNQNEASTIFGTTLSTRHQGRKKSSTRVTLSDSIFFGQHQIVLKITMDVTYVYWASFTKKMKFVPNFP